jgi:hemerythrin superfamily protein
MQSTCLARGLLVSSNMNAIELLKMQHEKVTKALDDVHENGARGNKLTTIADELVAHMVIEEHIFYPRVKELMKDMVGESFEEHAVARFELARLLQASGPEVKTRALVLKELLQHHIEEEEKEMFPKVQKNIDTVELEQLGARMKAAFETAVAKGYASFVPSRPGAGTRRPVVHNGLHAAH